MTRPLVWKRPNWPDPGWTGDCSVNGCSYVVEGVDLASTADDMRHHVATAHAEATA